MDERTRRKIELGKPALALCKAHPESLEKAEKRQRQRAPVAEAKIIPFRRRSEESRPDPAA